MPHEEFIPGLQFAVENELTPNEIKMVVLLTDSDMNADEIQEVTHAKATSSIYHTLKCLLMKKVIRQYIEAPETMHRYGLM